MYDRVLQLIVESPSPDRELARKLLTWLAFAARPLDDSELQEVLSLPGSGASFESDTYNHFQVSAAVACGGLVKADNNRIRFIHQTVIEYILDLGKRAAIGSAIDKRISQVVPSVAVANADLAGICLRYLAFNLPLRPMREWLGMEAANAYGALLRFPFARYAATYWTKHSKLFASSSDNKPQF